MKLKVISLDKKSLCYTERYTELCNPEIIYRSPITGNFPNGTVELPKNIVALVCDKYTLNEEIQVDKHSEVFIVGDEGKTISLINRASDYPGVQFWVKAKDSHDWEKIGLIQYFQSNQDFYDHEYKITGEFKE